MEKRILQIVLVFVGSIAVYTGALGLLSGITANLGDFYSIGANAGLEGNVLLDSNVRFFSGMWFGMGLIIFWMIPTIERHSLVFRLVAGMIFLGGVGRIISMLSFGTPSPLFVLFGVMELIFPVLILLQNKIAAPNAVPAAAH